MTRESETELSRHREAKVQHPERLLTPDDVAELTGLSVETLAQWRSQRRGFPFIKISHNCVRYRQSDLDGWLEARIVPTDQDRHGRE